MHSSCPSRTSRSWYIRRVLRQRGRIDIVSWGGSWSQSRLEAIASSASIERRRRGQLRLPRVVVMRHQCSITWWWRSQDLKSRSAFTDQILDMDDHDHRELIDQIVEPRLENADKILAQLSLDRLPTKEEVHRAIEERLLLPKDAFPAHWLPHYQE